MTLPDVNIWLALTFESHRHHSDAREWFDGLLQNGASFCRLTMLGFLRLAQTEAAFPGEAVTPEKAWSFYQAYLADGRVEFRAEPAGIDELLADHFVSLPRPSPKQVTDSYLAAFARLEGLELRTFDKGLEKHPLLGDPST